MQGSDVVMSLVELTPKGSISHMINASHETQHGISSAMGKSKRYISATLSKNKSVMVDTLLQIAHACGYEMLLTNGNDTIRVSLDSAV